jgi:hypothetical protein
MAELRERFERWQKYRDEKNEINRVLGEFVLDRSLCQEESEREVRLVQRYNDLYALMYQLQDDFTNDDWEAYDVDQEAFRTAERQSWLIENRYGSPNPPGGIADWWTV